MARFRLAGNADRASIAEAWFVAFVPVNAERFHTEITAKLDEAKRRTIERRIRAYPDVFTRLFHQAERAVDLDEAAHDYCKAKRRQTTDKVNERGATDFYLYIGEILANAAAVSNDGEALEELEDELKEEFDLIGKDATLVSVAHLPSFTPIDANIASSRQSARTHLFAEHAKRRPIL